MCVCVCVCVCVCERECMCLLNRLKQTSLFCYFLPSLGSNYSSLLAVSTWPKYILHLKTNRVWRERERNPLDLLISNFSLFRTMTTVELGFLASMIFSGCITLSCMSNR